MKDIKRRKLDQAFLHETLDYNKETGIFTCRARRKNIRVGEIAGSVNKTGYRLIGIDGKRYLASRLAWLYVYGQWPENQIDHINGIRDDNRIVNLKGVTNRGNSINHLVHRNGKLAGAYRHKCLKTYPWEAKIQINGKRKSLGCFATEQEAHNVYMAAYEKLERGDL